MKYILLILATLILATPAYAHFAIETQNREIYILKADDGDTKVILRFPLTVAYANELARRAPGADFTAPFMIPELVAGRMFYRLDSDTILDNYGRFVNFLLRDFRFSVNGVFVVPDMVEYTLIDTHAVEKNGGSIGSGLAATMGLLSLYLSDYPDQPYISDTLVVVSFYLPKVLPTDPLKVELLSAPFPTPEGVFFETRILDQRSGSVTLLTFKGSGFAPVTLQGSSATSFVHFIKQGMHHILIGFDHVLFVLCLVMAATRLRLLLWSVTGFTLGHTVTLAAGIFGYLPQEPWFIPLIELLIAASIVFMATLILVRRSGWYGFWLAGVIGLLHGFGFSFMLADILSSESSARAITLASFNIGVELGQLMIVLLAFSVLAFVTRISPLLGKGIRGGVALFACLAALMMMVDRGAALKQSLSIIHTLNTIQIIPKGAKDNGYKIVLFTK